MKTLLSILLLLCSTSASAQWGTPPTWGTVPVWGGGTTANSTVLYPRVLPDGRVQTCVANDGACGLKCAGDCNRDCIVTVDELMLCVNVNKNPKAYPYSRTCGYYKDRYNKQWVSLCDPNSDGQISTSDVSCISSNVSEGCHLDARYW